MGFFEELHILLYGRFIPLIGIIVATMQEMWKFRIYRGVFVCHVIFSRRNLAQMNASEQWIKPD
jgi:hypothetical protein